jgi:hypothetical protein
MPGKKTHGLKAYHQCAKAAGCSGVKTKKPKKIRPTLDERIAKTKSEFIKATGAEKMKVIGKLKRLKREKLKRDDPVAYARTKRKKKIKRPPQRIPKKLKPSAIIALKKREKVMKSRIAELQTKFNKLKKKTNTK